MSDSEQPRLSRTVSVTTGDLHGRRRRISKRGASRSRHGLKLSLYYRSTAGTRGVFFAITLNYISHLRRLAGLGPSGALPAGIGLPWDGSATKAAYQPRRFLAAPSSGHGIMINARYAWALSAVDSGPGSSHCRREHQHCTNKYATCRLASSES